jgi:hypothetical protein
MPINIKRRVYYSVAGICILLLSSLLLTTASFAADPVRPLNPFCEEIGDKGELCAIDQVDEDNQDVGLLAEDGIVRKVFDVMIWLTALLCGVFITVGAFKLTTSGGNKDSVKSGKNMIIYAAVGLAVILLSNLILNVIISFASSAG